MVAMSRRIAHRMWRPARQIRIGRKALFRQPARTQHRTNSHQGVYHANTPTYQNLQKTLLKVLRFPGVGVCLESYIVRLKMPIALLPGSTSWGLRSPASDVGVHDLAIKRLGLFGQRRQGLFDTRI